MPADVLIHDSADKTPPPVPGRHPLTMVSYADAPRPAGWRLPAQAWLIITAACLAPVALVLWAVYGAVSELLLLAPWIAPLSGGVLVAVALLSLLGLLAGLAARGWVSVQQARVVRSRLGVPVDVVAQMRADPLALEQQALTLELATAPYRLHPNLSTLSAPSAPKPAEPAQLAPPEVQPIPSTTWLRWIEAAPHAMLAAETGAGKTTTALHLLAPRLASGESCFIIDPHASEWGGLPSIGGGEDWRAVADAMEAIISLYAARQQARATSLVEARRELPADHFGRLTVVVDEAFLAKQALDSGRESIWRRFVPVMGSGARKIGISLILLTQTANVEDIGLSTPLRENYTRIALDTSAARKLIIAEEPSRARREQLLAALGGVRWPAVAEHAGQIELLDRSDLAATPSLDRYARQVWLPPPAMPRVDRETATRKALAALKARGVSRDDARQVYRLEFTNKTWGDV